MSTAEIKMELHQVIDNVPEDTLAALLNYIKQFSSQTAEQIELSGYIKKILTEDKELLEKLAQ